MSHCTGLRRIFEAPSTRQLAARAAAVAGSGNCLFHGTRCVVQVLKTMQLRYSRIGIKAVFLTRSPQVAAYWAVIERDDDEGCGSILILDKASLRRSYKVERHHDPFWDHDPDRIDEEAEAIFRRNVDLTPHLIGVVSQPVRLQP